jgi:hypothetical protein
MYSGVLFGGPEVYKTGFASLRRCPWLGKVAMGCIRNCYCLSTIFSLIKWIDGEMTSRAALPKRIYFLRLEEYAIDAWNVITQAAALQTLMCASYQKRQLNLPLRFDRLDSLHDPYSLPCHLPEQFEVAMREVLEHKTAFISFSAIYEPIWDYEKLLMAYGDPSPEVCY